MLEYLSNDTRILYRMIVTNFNKGWAWSDVIFRLRIPLAICVVFIHFDIYNDNFIFYRDVVGKPEWVELVVRFFSNILPSVAVPLFFLFSGFLFFYGKDFNRSIYQHKILSRARSLLIPYLLWNLIAIVKEYATNYTHIEELNLSWYNILMSFIDIYQHEGIVKRCSFDGAFYPIDLPLWFVRDLIIVVFFTPIIYWVILKCKIYSVLCLGFINVLYNIFFSSPNNGWPGQLICAFFFFAWGAYYSINRQDFVMVFRKVRLAPFIYVCLLIGDLLITSGDIVRTLIHQLQVLFGIITFVYMASLFNNQINKWLVVSNSGFFIFALHYLIRGHIGIIMESLLSAPSNPVTVLAFYFLTPIVICVVCIAIYQITKRFFPRLCYLLSGGR